MVLVIIYTTDSLVAEDRLLFADDTLILTFGCGAKIYAPVR